MTVRIRHACIFFALASAIYWEVVAAFLVIINPLAGHYVAPYRVIVLANTVTATVYAVIALIFCHWLVRLAVRQGQKRSDS